MNRIIVFCFAIFLLDCTDLNHTVCGLSKKKIPYLYLIDEAIESGASGILLAPATSDELVESCKKARESGIYVALIDSSINQCEFDACYMTDNVNAGQMAAKEISWKLLTVYSFLNG